MTKPSFHFIGIGGIGMSGLAAMYQHAGYQVSGSDRGANLPENQMILEPLRKQGIRIFPQDGSYYQESHPDYLVYSSAIESDNPDFVAAGESVKRLHRAEALQKIITESRFECTIAVSGSCGKSSVTAYLAETLYHLGEDPTCLNGAIVKQFQSEQYAGNFRPGNGKFFIFEADESDKSLTHYTPDYALVLNIGTDHYSKEELAKVFAQLIDHCAKGVVIASDVAQMVQPYLTSTTPMTLFEPNLCEKSENFALLDYRIANLESSRYAGGRKLKCERKTLDPTGIDAYMRIYGFHKEDCQIFENFPVATFQDHSCLRLPMAGFHNALNALAIYALLNQLGFDRESTLDALSRFSGVFRRFDYAGTTTSGAMVFDDYAHNPEKIFSCIRAAREMASGDLFFVFQPHGYGPLGFMREELFQVLEKGLKNNEKFIMLEPFYAGGTSSFKPTAEEVITTWRMQGRRKRYQHFPDREKLTDYLLLASHPGDVIVIMGARDNSLSTYAKSLCAVND